MRRLLLAGLAALAPLGPAQADDFGFDVDKYESKAFSFGGSAETKLEHLDLNRSGALYATSFWDDRIGDVQRATETIDLEARYSFGDFSVAARTETTLRLDHDGFEEDTILQEGFASYKPGAGVSFELGKRVLRWGKGYAWNPVGFVERAKDPSDPELSREGFVMAVADVVRSFDGPVKTVALTGVALPVAGDINDDYGSDEDKVNLAAKLYLLAWDTDIDFVVLGEGSRTARYGIDFSRNITANFEIHGEWAYIVDAQKKFTDANYDIHTTTADTQQFLLGLRYLTDSELTIIAEYFHNGGGYDSDEISAFADLAAAGIDAYDATGSTTLLDKATTLANAGYGKFTPGTDYAYLKLSQKDPFGWLYVTPAATTIVNLNDGSLQFSPEVTYTGIDNLSLRLRGTVLAGGEGDEFGEKTTQWKIELTAKVYF